ncbi:toll/interleukin-1 receptor domain-containing protein [Microbulbifer salipaludis]|uniref:Toll/interleukin-1 receptor domain-containing protein n=1 Tax=Microbulbifer salipaludis TaxID=187980 RepID=A0ABS3E8E0_9GAMM|nr:MULTISPECIES: toll/interleukin-1 receptor domain-containing protein [Microbulbifer]MBN8431566.1 toll/interleukin-1 receptor domain-containing protein [Microbulbifer salipaludis]MCK7596805.1 toll/interleukin-1 receptor domain-containing protein [Microbulbifer sp. CAU 1566]
MAFFTKDEVRQAARAKVNNSYKINAKAILESEIRSATSYDSFDVFLSHSSKDAELVLGVKEILTRKGIKVYVDWQDDPQANRESVSAETAELLRARMKQSKSLIFLATDNASGSKWMPWELGYFDGFSGGSVAVLPVLDYASSSFRGQEYLGLYPTVDKGQYSNGQPETFVRKPGAWLTLDSFRKGNTSWNSYR